MRALSLGALGRLSSRTGFKPYGVKTYAVKGHPFGLELNAQDKKAIIAFLKAL